MAVTFEMTNWSDTTTTLEIVSSNGTAGDITYPVLDPQLEEFMEQLEYNETLMTSGDETVRQDLSQAQFIIVYVITTFVSLLSVIGSSLIILSVICRQGNKKQQQQQRQQSLQSNTLFQFLLGLSICDILFSITILWGSFAIPTDQAKPYSFAAGNDVTCSLNALFSIVFSTGGAFYNCWISLHFWRTVQPKRKQQKDGWIQIGCHLSAAIISLSLGVAGFAVDGYGPHPFVDKCYTSGSFAILRTIIGAVLTLAATYFTASLVRTVRMNIQKSEQYLKRSMELSFTPPDGGGEKNLMEVSHTTKATYMGASRTTTTTSHNKNISTGTWDGGSLIDTADPTAHVEVGNSKREGAALGNSSLPDHRKINSSHGGNNVELSSTQTTAKFRNVSGESKESDYSCSESTTKKKEKSNSKDKEVATQACWYYAVYLNSVLVPLIAIAVMNGTDAYENPGKPEYFVFLLCIVICVPIQGALNFVVFIRPRVKSWREYYEREQEESEAMKAWQNNNLQTIKVGKSGGMMPSFFTILKKAVLEEVPKKRKRQVIPLSGASNTVPSPPVELPAEKTFACELSEGDGFHDEERGLTGISDDDDNFGSLGGDELEANINERDSSGDNFGTAESESDVIGP